MPYADPEKRREAKRTSERRRRALAGAGLEPLTLPTGRLPTRDELLAALAAQAKNGNVPAIRLLLEEYRRDGNEDTPPVRSKLDELAAKRAARAG